MEQQGISSRELLRQILQPHVNLAIDLLDMVISLNSDDPSIRYEIVSVIVFLAGIDKMLSLAFELLCLTKTVNWKWMSAGYRKPVAGFIECQPGLGKKIAKLKELGINVSDLDWLINLRNEYVHACHMYAGYGLNLNETSPTEELKAYGPQIGWISEPIIGFTPEMVRFQSEHLIQVVGSFVDGTNWLAAWQSLAQKIKGLPVNPEPEYSKCQETPDTLEELINTLNNRYIGEGMRIINET